MHDPYRIVQPAVAVGVIHARRAAPPLPPQRWFGPFAWRTWAIDWCSYDGWVEDIADGRRRGPVRRAPHTWNLYAPGLAYRHQDVRHANLRDELWFYFALAKPWPVLTGRQLTVLHDPDERLVPHVHAMAALAQHREPGADTGIAGHVGSSRVDLQACKLEYSIVSPK